MGNENCKSIPTLLQPGDTDPSARINFLMNQERDNLETMLETLKKEPNLGFSQTEIDQYQEILCTLNYFKNNGGIIQAKERHNEEVLYARRQLSASQQNNEKLLKQNSQSLLNNLNMVSQLVNESKEQKKSKKVIQSLKLQHDQQQKEQNQRKLRQDQEIKLQQEDIFQQKEQFEQGKKQKTQKVQEQLGGLKKEVEEKMNEIEYQDIYLQSQYADKQKLFQSLQVQQQQKEQEHQQQVEQIKRDSTTQINKSLLDLQNRLTQQSNNTLAQKQKDWDQEKSNLNGLIIQLNQEQYDLDNKVKPDEYFKKQLEKLNPQQEIKPSEVEFIKQFQAVQEEQLTVEQVKVIEEKHQEVEQVILKSIKKYQEKPLSSVSEEEQKKIDGYQGVLLMHSLLAQQGITSYITDKPMEEIEQSSKGVYQQKIIQCGIQDSSSYLTATYTSSEQMEKQILDAQGLQNFVQIFKNDMATIIAEEDVTPLSIQVFAVSPPYVKFQIKVIFNRKINFNSKDFSSLGIDLETQNLLDKAELSIDMFDPKYNMTWDDLKSQTDQRGALPIYNKPGPVPQIYNFPFGYKGLGLKVLKRYGNDQRWIRADTQPETWIVLFHGTGYSNLKGIIDQKINPGKNNVYGGSKCRITGTIIKEGECQNTYLADIVSEAEPYSINLNQKDGVPYSLVFQCRVNPKKVKSPETCPNYYTVENPLDDIRPYRLLIKKTDD